MGEFPLHARSSADLPVAPLCVRFPWAEFLISSVAKKNVNYGELAEKGKKLWLLIGSVKKWNVIMVIIDH